VIRVVKWIFNNEYLEQNELLFYIAVTVIILVIAITIYLVTKELRK